MGKKLSFCRLYCVTCEVIVYDANENPLLSEPVVFLRAPLFEVEHKMTELLQMENAFSVIAVDDNDDLIEIAYAID